MSTYEFWYEDIRLFECYLKAYHNRTNKTAWMNGLYIFEAVSAAINNVMPGAISRALNGKQGKPLKYHEKPIDLFEKFPVKQKNTDTESYAFNNWVHKFRKLKRMEA